LDNDVDIIVRIDPMDDTVIVSAISSLDISELIYGIDMPLDNADTIVINIIDMIIFITPP
jgi:hypothetical protein